MTATLAPRRSFVSSPVLLFALACSSPSPNSASGGGAGNNSAGGSIGAGGANAGAGIGGTGAGQTSLGSGGNPTAGSAGASSGAGGSATAGAAAMAGNAGTPATTNDSCLAAPAGTIGFSPPSGSFEGSVTVTLTANEAMDEIRYTTDHSAPSVSSMLYTGPLTFNASTDLRVQGFSKGIAVSKASGGVYVARGADATHDLGVLVLDSFGKALPATSGGFPGGATNRDYIDAAVLGFALDAGSTSLAATPTLATAGAFHIRGQSSASYAKKPFRLELREADTTDRDCPMFGMPRESDWVLHAPFPDKALIRNAFSYSLGRDVGLAAPRTAFVELYLNTANRPLAAGDYQGVYLLVETIKNQKDRLNLQQLKETDTALPAIAGGYIFKFEWQVMDIEQQLACPSGQQNCWNWLEVVDPSPWVPTQQAYLTQYLQQFVTALHSANPSDPTSGYPAFLDTASVVNTVIVNELTRNMDAYVRSQFFYKDRDSKLFAGPLWDFDLIAGVGSSSTYANMSSTGFQYESNATRITATVDWFPKLLADPAFKAQLVARWKELRTGLLSNSEVEARITRLTTGLSAGADRNFAKWNNLATQRIGFFDTPTANTWQGQVAAMRTWMTARLTWLDSQWM